ncbi:NADP-specific glutamate dehydrogenase [Klebsiella pneumoniae]|nr:NADP-specific glutamate dehydrogenase [Klebsiella pneumoniae]
MDQTCTLEGFLTRVQQRDPHQTEFAQAVREVMTTLWPFLEENPRYRQLALLERLVEPERVIQFRVVWVDDRNQVQVNRAWRVQFNSAIGPYKGGMRFHPSVNLSILKFLGFEQTFKNALTTLPMGGGKGGSDFDPKGKSDGEVMRFCQALMTELYRHLGPDTDVPAGDIGVGGREVGFMAGMMRKLSNNSACVFTGKGLSFGGSLIRPEATGYGLIYFTEAMLKRHGLGFEGARVAVSGSGNVAQYAIEKAMELGARVVTASDSNGTVVDEAGFTKEKLARLIDIKERAHGRVADYAREFGLTYLEGQQPWSVPVDIALPCATQNELDVDAARQLIANGVKAVAEGANMPTTIAATDLFLEAGVLFAPGKAANAGGVATSGLEMAQNAARMGWKAEKVDARLHHIMLDIHHACVQYGGEAKQTNYVRGAEYRRFREGCRCHAGPGRDLTSPNSIPAAARRDASHDVIVITTFPRC